MLELNKYWPQNLYNISVGLWGRLEDPRVFLRLASKSQVEVVSSMASVFTKNARAWNVDNGGVDEVFPTLGVLLRGGSLYK